MQITISRASLNSAPLSQIEAFLMRYPVGETDRPCGQFTTFIELIGQTCKYADRDIALDTPVKFMQAKSRPKNIGVWGWATEERVLIRWLPGTAGLADWIWATAHELRHVGQFRRKDTPSMISESLRMRLKGQADDPDSPHEIDARAFADMITSALS